MQGRAAMKFVFHIPATQSVDLTGKPLSLAIDGIHVELVSAHNVLSGVTFVVEGVQPEIDPNTNRVLTWIPDIEERVFALASYVADLILADSGVDAISPYQLVGNSAEVIAESPQEEAQLLRNGTTNQRSVPTSIALSKAFDVTFVTKQPAKRSAINHYARGLRSADPFVRFEEFYKAVEQFAPSPSGKALTGIPFDKEIERQASADKTFDANKVKTLRHLRNRIVHPLVDYSRPSHLSSQQLQHINLVAAALPDMERLARLIALS